MELIFRHSNKLRDRVWLTYLIIGPEGYFRREIDILFYVFFNIHFQIKFKKSQTLKVISKIDFFSLFASNILCCFMDCRYFNLLVGMAGGLFGSSTFSE